MSISKQKAGSTLYVTVKDKSGNSSKTKMVVKDVTAPAAPKLNAITSKSTTVTGTAERYAIIYVKVGSKTIGKGKALSTGKFSVKISKQKKGTTLTVTVVDKSGNTSKATKYTAK